MRLTGSGFGRAERCPPSTFLPSVTEDPGPYAKHGIAVHRFLCLVAEVGRDAALELMEEEFRDVCAAIDVDQLPHAQPEAWAVEVAFAWDWLAGSARELYRGSGARVYGTLEPTEVAGTADLIGLSGSTVYVGDVKTGFKYLGPPEDSPQLLYYAVAAAAAYGATDALVFFVRVTDGVTQYFSAQLDAFALAAAAERLRGIVEGAIEAETQWEASHQVTPIASDHCKYCPAFLRCPAKATLARELALQVDSKDPTQLSPVLDAENVPAALERLWAAQELLERVKKSLDEYAASHPVQLADGRVYGAIESSEESFEPTIAASAVAQLFGPDVANDAVELKKTLTKAALRRALTKAVKGTDRKITHVEREAHEAIRAAGGSKVVTWTTVKAFKPKLLR